VLKKDNPPATLARSNKPVPRWRKLDPRFHRRRLRRRHGRIGLEGGVASQAEEDQAAASEAGIPPEGQAAEPAATELAETAAAPQSPQANNGSAVDQASSTATQTTDADVAVGESAGV